MIKIATSLREFHLIEAAADNNARHKVLRVPEGLSYLVTGDAANGPRLVPETEGINGVILEPIARQREMVLLVVVSAAQQPVSINGCGSAYYHSGFDGSGSEHSFGRDHRMR